MSTSLATGKGAFPCGYAQLGDVGLICNGHDANAILDLRTGELKELGIPAPDTDGGADFTATGGSAGNVNGAVRYRMRWVDASTGAFSLPSAETSGQFSSKQVTLDKSAVGDVPTRATHWIVERTEAGGSLFHPVNRDADNPYGTALGTDTYVDNVGDETLGQRAALAENQGQPRKFALAVANGAVLHGLGGRVYSFTGSLTNGMTTLTGPANTFTVEMVGEDVSFDGDSDGKSYEILSFTSDTEVELAEAYAGDTKSSAPARMSGPRNLGTWCEPGEPEHWGSQEVGALSNEILYGDNEPVVCGVPLGPAGLLVLKPSQMLLHSYQLKPNFSGTGGDGRIVPLSSRRGALGRSAARVVDGRVYGMDVFGVWRAEPGGEPVEIGGALQQDWKGLDFDRGDFFHIRHDAVDRKLYFFVVEAGDSYAKRAFVWDLERERWVGNPGWWTGMSCGAELDDLNGGLRACVFSQVDGSASAYLWFLGIGTTMGAPPSTTPLVGTVSGTGTSTTASVTGAAYPTSGEKLKGVPVTLRRAADGSEESSIITDNTSSGLEFNALSGTAPKAGDTLIVGPIPAVWRTGWQWGQTPEEATRKKTWHRAYVWLAPDSEAVDLRCRVRFDGSNTAYAERLTKDEDGVQTVAAQAAVTMKPDEAKHVYRVDLGHQSAFVCELEFYSVESGAPWKVLGCVLVYEVDGADEPRRK
ncbi:MAG: hypothetical protein M5U26_03515 [Planctomycetota bacterium]|nr:hypothetical protein [Planctomycetota bacterium]